MKLTSLVAVYFLFFIGSAFLLLPFGVKTDEEVGNAVIPGQARSAPHRFNLPRHLVRAAVLAAVLTALFDLNYIFGWITPDDLDLYRRIFGD
jgi:predicted secreted protein